MTGNPEIPDNSDGAIAEPKPLKVIMRRGAFNDGRARKSIKAPVELPYIVPVCGPTLQKDVYDAEQKRKREREERRAVKAALMQALEDLGAELPEAPSVRRQVVDTSDVYDREKAEKLASSDMIDRVVVAVLAAVAVLGLGLHLTKEFVLSAQRSEALAMLGDDVGEGLGEDKTYIVKCEEHAPGADLQVVASDYLDGLNGMMNGISVYWELDSSFGTKEGYGFFDKSQDLTCFVVFQVELE